MLKWPTGPTIGTAKGHKHRCHGHYHWIINGKLLYQRLQPWTFEYTGQSSGLHPVRYPCRCQTTELKVVTALVWQWLLGKMLTRAVQPSSNIINLANLVLVQGKEEAQGLLVQAMEACEANLGYQHPLTLVSVWRSSSSVFFWCVCVCFVILCFYFCFYFF